MIPKTIEDLKNTKFIVPHGMQDVIIKHLCALISDMSNDMWINSSYYFIHDNLELNHSPNYETYCGDKKLKEYTEILATDILKIPIPEEKNQAWENAKDLLKAKYPNHRFNYECENLQIHRWNSGIYPDCRRVFSSAFSYGYSEFRSGCSDCVTVGCSMAFDYTTEPTPPTEVKFELSQFIEKFKHPNYPYITDKFIILKKDCIKECMENENLTKITLIKDSE